MSSQLGGKEAVSVEQEEVLAPPPVEQEKVPAPLVGQEEEPAPPGSPAVKQEEVPAPLVGQEVGPAPQDVTPACQKTAEEPGQVVAPKTPPPPPSKRKVGLGNKNTA